MVSPYIYLRRALTTVLLVYAAADALAGLSIIDH